MSTLTLHDYLASCLNEPPESERLASFLAQSEVAVSIHQLEELVQQLAARWQPTERSPDASTQASVAINRLALPNDSVTNPVSSESLQSLDEAGVPADTPTERTNAAEETATTDSENGLPASPQADESAAPMRSVPTTHAQPPTARPMKTISIANATVGKPYDYTLDFGSLGLPTLADHALLVDSAPGLTYEPVTQRIQGTPLTPGEFNFELAYRPATTEPDRPTLTLLLKLLVNPDPRSLWKELPSDTQDPYYKPDSAKGMVMTGDIRLVAASVRGRSHAHEGKFRDDDFSLAYLEETGWYLLSVADGAGSARYARRGAQLACQTVTQYLTATVEPQSWEHLDEGIQQYVQIRAEPQAGAVKRHLYEILGKAVFAAYKAIESEAQTKAASLKDYATTLVTVLAKPLSEGWFVGGFWVGDGGVGIYQAQGEPLLLGVPDGGEYAGQTRFLTMPETIATNFFDRFRFALVADFTAVVLMTDGVTDPKFQTDNNLARKEKWDELWAELQPSVLLADAQSVPTQLQDWLGFWSPGNHDDRTIALLYPYAGNPKN